MKNWRNISISLSFLLRKDSWLNLKIFDSQYFINFSKIKKYLDIIFRPFGAFITCSLIYLKNNIEEIGNWFLRLMFCELVNFQVHLFIYWWCSKSIFHFYGESHLKDTVQPLNSNAKVETVIPEQIARNGSVLANYQLRNSIIQITVFDRFRKRNSKYF